MVARLAAALEAPREEDEPDTAFRLLDELERLLR